MLNIISFLLIVLASVVCLKSADAPSQLLDLGILILAGHAFATLARHLRLPAVIGYVIAGIMLGPGGLGLLHSGITADMTVIESILFMLLVAHVAKSSCHGASLSTTVPSLGAGALAAFIILAVATGMLTAASLPLRQALMFGLFAATLSPVMLHAVLHRDTGQSLVSAHAIGAFATAFVLWSAAAAVFDPESVHRLRTALAPLLVGATSLVAGIVWGLVTEHTLIRPTDTSQPLFSVAAIFLAYPLAEPFGLDIMFLGAGFGIYAGMFSSRDLLPPDTAAIAAIVVFTLFGARLPVEDAFLLGIEGWRMVGILVASLALGRFVAGTVTRQLPMRSGAGTPPFTVNTLSGPLALLVIFRFGPALSFSAASPDETPADLAVITTAMLLFATLVPALMITHRCFSALRGQKPLE